MFSFSRNGKGQHSVYVVQYLNATILCSYGWFEENWIVVSVPVGVLKKTI